MNYIEGKLYSLNPNGEHSVLRYDKKTDREFIFKMEWMESLTLREDFVGKYLGFNKDAVFPPLGSIDKDEKRRLIKVITDT